MLVGLFSYIVIGRSGDRVSLARFRRNKFRLHPSHDYVAGPSRSRGHGRPRRPNLPYRHFRAYTIAFCYHLSDIMSDSYGSELRTYESLPSIAEPLEVIVIFDLSEHRFRFNRSFAAMHQSFITGQQFPCHCPEFIIAMIHLNGSRIVFSFIAHASQRTSGAVFRTIYALRRLISQL